MDRPIEIAVIGAGVMGSLHARVVAEHPECRLVQVFDEDPARAGALAERYGARGIQHFGDLAADAVVVASPTETHADLAVPLLRAGLPTLVEKPLAHNPDRVAEVLAVSRAEGVPVMCGFVERFNPVVRMAPGLLDGPVRHVLTQRHSPPADRIRSSVVTDLLIHDVDLALRLVGDLNARVTSAVAPAWRNDFSDLADCSLSFSNGAIATCSASRIGHRKIRSVSITTDHCLVELDLLRQDVTVYRHKSHDALGATAGYRNETVIDVPFVRVAAEPLSAQLSHFVALLRGEVDAESERAGIVAPHQIIFGIEQLTPVAQQLAQEAFA